MGTERWPVSKPSLHCQTDLGPTLSKKTNISKCNVLWGDVNWTVLCVCVCALPCLELGTGFVLTQSVINAPSSQINRQFCEWTECLNFFVFVCFCFAFSQLVPACVSLCLTHFEHCYSGVWIIFKLSGHFLLAIFCFHLRKCTLFVFNFVSETKTMPAT